MRPSHTPIGLKLSRVARIVGRAFDEALTEAGGSLPAWLVLLNLKTRKIANQRELAQAIGVREPTLTKQLHDLETRGLLTRQRHPDNRRIHLVELTEAGEQAFLQLRDAAIAFDRRLRTGLRDEETAQLADLLDRLVHNVGGREHANPLGPDPSRAADPVRTAAQPPNNPKRKERA
jgi:MarR family transcriptional regulator, transcriptional regulator for hemolysin